MPMETAPKKPAKKPPKKITETYLRNYGLFYLGRFASSVENFRKIMRRRIDNSCRFHKEQDRSACNEMLERVIADFMRSGLLNDDVYARGLTNSLRRRGLSGKSVLMKLGQRGIANAAAKTALAEWDRDNAATDGTDSDLIAALRTARKKRIGPFASALRETLDPEKKKQRSLAALARAGFEYDLCLKIMGMSAEDAEEMLLSARL
jgi:regulatory protein